MDVLDDAWQALIWSARTVSQRLVHPPGYIQSPPNYRRSSFSEKRGERQRVRREAGFICASLALRSRSGEQMEWLGKMIIRVRRVCSAVASRIRSRRSGLLKLRRDVRACEYEDVRVMWEMLKRNKTELDPSHGGRKRQLCSFFGWARSAPCLGRRF